MFFDLPSGAKVDKFLAGMPTSQWLTWTNPRNQYNNAIILAAGAGGAGGSATGASGAGGGAGGFGHIYCPLSLLPDTLYINVGLGGTGTGGATYVSLYPQFVAANALIVCNGGTLGTSVAGGGGAVGIFNTLGIAQGYTGGTGGAGGAAGASGVSSLPATGSSIYGGGGGGGTGVTGGGGMTSVSSLYPSIPVSGGEGVVGNNGFVIWKPFTVFGGCGGGGSNTTGGSGGRGIMGSGGGGGGRPSAAGGRGGDGFVIIICY